MSAYVDGFLRNCQSLQELNQTTPLGRNMRKYFMMDPELVPVNHGSYGAVTRLAFEHQKYWEERMESDLDGWFRFQKKKLDKVRDALAEYIGADSGDVAFVPNATAGMNAVLRSIKFKSGDAVLSLDVAYGMTKRTLQFLEDQEGVRLLQVHVKFPFSEQQLLQDVKAAIDSADGSIQLATFSHISSAPSLILPIKELSRLCREQDILCLVDGAHATGQIQLNVKDVDADFYVANGHKWLCSAKTAALLWVKPCHQQRLHPATISHEYKKGFTEEFDMIGTFNYCAWFTFGSAIEFRRRLGEARILEYTRDLAVWVQERVPQIWGTKALAVSRENIGNMVNVEFPMQDLKTAHGLVGQLMLTINSFLPVFEFDGKVYARFSCQFYNERADYEFVAKTILCLLKH